jgi:hypothetical protein
LLGALFYGVCQDFIIFGGFHELMPSRSSKTQDYPNLHLILIMLVNKSAFG